MEFPAEATVHLNLFRSKGEVMKILQFYGFEVLAELGEGEVRIIGPFSRLGAVKVQLEELLESRPDPAASSGTISSYYNDTSTRGRSLHRDRLVSPTSPTSHEDIPSDHRSTRPKQWASSSPQRGASLGRAFESLAVETDVFMYADRVRKNDIQSILSRHNVHLKHEEDGDSTTITLTGKDSKMAAGEMRRFMEDLRARLRTQEVPPKMMNRDSYALLEQIRSHNHVYNLVFVREMPDRLHLVGPSEESFDLQQRLLGKKQRKTDKPRRSNILSSLFQRNTKGQSAAAAAAAPAAAAAAPTATYDDPSLGGAAGYSLPRHHHGEQEHERAPARNSLLRRSRSEYSPKKSRPPTSSPTQETPTTSPPPVSVRKSMKQSFNHKKKSFKELFGSFKKK